jgi:PRC-barrel domain
MQTVTRHGASTDHSLIASDRVEGAPVRRSTGEKVGTIQRLMIDKLSGNVAYAVLSFGGFLGLGEKHLPVPWARLKYSPELEAYEVNLTDEGIRQGAILPGLRGVRLGRPRARARAAQLLQSPAILGQ